MIESSPGFVLRQEGTNELPASSRRSTLYIINQAFRQSFVLIPEAGKPLDKKPA